MLALEVCRSSLPSKHIWDKPVHKKRSCHFGRGKSLINSRRWGSFSMMADGKDVCDAKVTHQGPARSSLVLLELQTNTCVSSDVLIRV